MPVSYFPCFFPMLLFGVPIAIWNINRKAGVFSGSLAILLIITVFLRVYIPGWKLRSKAIHGEPEAQYLYAQWTENHNEEIQQYFVWPFEPDLIGGFILLQQSAAQDYAPAVWLVGQRLKMGIGVPRPPNWIGPGGNMFPQPDLGQPLIDHAVKDLHYNPSAEPATYYEQWYRKGRPPTVK